MNEITKKTIEGATVTITLGKSAYGNPEPQIEIRLPKGTHFRRLRAALYLVAAEVESATAHSDGWCVVTEVLTNEHGRVYLELLKGSEMEARRGVDLLRRIAS